MQDCIIIGSGPAALLAADFLSRKGLAVSIFEKRPSPGWKLLVAGSSGLNVGYDCATQDLPKFYPKYQTELAHCFANFDRAAWLQYLTDLGEEPYLGSGKRYFIKNKTAAKLLQSWTERLTTQGVKIHYGQEFLDFASLSDQSIVAKFESGQTEKTKKLLLAMGGASWEPSLPSWLETMRSHGIDCEDFAPANMGFHLKASPDFFAAAEGKAIKGLTLTTSRGSKQGELMITRYGLEGTPVYTVGASGSAKLDLKPDISEEKLLERLRSAPGTVWKKIERTAKLSDGALLLLEHLAHDEDFATVEAAAHGLKNFSIELLEPRPLTESISSLGGVSWSELTAGLELKKIPGVFCAGEMINWDAPTGGFLLQACVSMAYTAAASIIKRLS